MRSLSIPTVESFWSELEKIAARSEWSNIYEAGLRENKKFLRMRSGLSASQRRKYRRLVLQQMHELPKVRTGRATIPDYRKWSVPTPSDLGIQKEAAARTQAEKIAKQSRGKNKWIAPTAAGVAGLSLIGLGLATHRRMHPRISTLRQGVQSQLKSLQEASEAMRAFHEDAGKVRAMQQRTSARIKRARSGLDSLEREIAAITKTSAARTKAEKRRRRRRTLQAVGGAATGMTAGYLAGRSVPAIMKAFGKAPQPLPPRVRNILLGLSTITGATLPLVARTWVNELPPQSRNQLGPSGAVQPKDGSLAQRREGHPSAVPAGSVLPDAGGGKSVPLRARRRVVRNRRTGDRADHFRSGVGRYEFGGKAPRTYRYARPVRDGKYES